MKILRILVPIDFTKESDLSLEWAILLAQKTRGSTIYLFHCIPHPEMKSTPSYGGVGFAMTKKEMFEKLSVIQQKLPTDILSFTHVEEGTVPEVISRVCEEKDIDLVIMTTRGRRGVKRILDGSITEDTVRIAPCPVIVLHLNEKTKQSVHR